MYIIKDENGKRVGEPYRKIVTANCAIPKLKLNKREKPLVEWLDEESQNENI